MKNFVTFLVLSVLSCQAFAAEMKGRLRVEDGFQPISFEKLNDGIAPAMWDMPTWGPTVNSVILGGFTGPSDHNVQLGNGAGGTITLPVKVVGVQYILSADPVNTTPVNGVSTNTTVTGKQVTVVGNGVGSKLITLTEDIGVKPYTHIRPIFANLDSEVLLDIFKKKKSW
ncbi:hypothetical protein [Photobacterium leiognathi]|uniref:hypothetical protein n=1 Tax=Photobacterium leiognathi TaxID=553611 RepID=UPI0027393396|nr:hypothetical protein [Photobacterium leiognathi]